MGHQSYICFFDTDEERQVIIDAINEYQKIALTPMKFITDPNDPNKDIILNAETGEILENIGEELHDMVCEAKVIKPYTIRIQKGSRCIMFSNSGGRGDTFRFFEKRLHDNTFSRAFRLFINPFTSSMFKRLEKSNLWTKIEIQHGGRKPPIPP